MKLSEVKFYAPDHLLMNENKLAMRGALLHSFGVDLECLPETLFAPCVYVPTIKDGFFDVYEKVYVKDIIGTTYEEYAGDTWLTTFLKVKRLDHYILKGCITKGKYLRMLKLDYWKQPPIVQLSKTPCGYVVDGNGNHRIAAYKMMYLADLASEDREVSSQAGRLYWLNAKIHVPGE